MEAATTPLYEIPERVQQVREGHLAGVVRAVPTRRAQLQQLRRLVTEQEDRITAALAADLGKPWMEAFGAEVAFTVTEIDHALKHLDRWTSPTKVRVPMTLKPGSARVVPEPLGTVLVISPWNYPLQLLLAPLVPALAAGNTAVLKPSEVAPHTSDLIAELVPRYLDERAVQVVTGGVEETSALLQERFDHIFYTGSGTVGRLVMAAAAKHLTPVTLELGGKSPTIVAADADLDVAARRIAWGKFLNAGQTCVAPDYVLVEEQVEAPFLDALVTAIRDFYGDDPARSPDYCRIVNERHWNRLYALLDGEGYEATVVGGTGDRVARYLAPTVLSGVKPDARVMQDEIFGPILPVLPVADVEEAIRFVNDHPKPLALYVFSASEATAQRVIEATSSGGVCVNHVVMQLSVPELPFGGVGESGMGAYHGRAGFDTFSHAKPVLTKGVRPDPSVMYPPYKGWKQKLIRRVL